MIDYEIHEMRGFFGRIHGYKVLCYADVPGIDHKILISTRQFESESGAAAYIERMEQQKEQQLILY